MSSFTEPLTLTEPDGDANHLIVGREFFYYLFSKDSNYRVYVPKGAITDLSSHPWFTQWLIPKFGLHNQPAVVHDHVYRTGKIQCQYEDVWEEMTVSKDIADNIFLEAMKVKKVNPLRRKILYSGVRHSQTAKIVWKGHRAND